MFTKNGHAKCERCGRFVADGEAVAFIKPWNADMPDEERMDIIHAKEGTCPSAKHLWKRKEGK